MYDEITCEHQLPKTGYKLPERHDGWQTKDLENLLDRYTITVDGRLVLHRVRYEDVPEQERPYYGTPAWDGPFGGWVGSLRSVPAGDEEVPCHGDVRFYDAFRVKGGEGRVWIEFKARFTEGRLSRIEVEEVRDLPPTKTLEIGGGRFTAAESGLGFDIIKLGEEPEVEWEEGPVPQPKRRLDRRGPVVNPRQTAAKLVTRWNVEDDPASAEAPEMSEAFFGLVLTYSRVSIRKASPASTRSTTTERS